jgi:hypothetical protein
MGDRPGKLETTLVFEKDTRRTRRFTVQETDAPPIISTLYVEQWALRKLTGGSLPQRVRVTIEVHYELETRQQIFRELVDTQNKGVTDEEAYDETAKRWGITVDAVEAIAAEGIEKGWP